MPSQSDTSSPPPQHQHQPRRISDDDHHFGNGQEHGWYDPFIEQNRVDGPSPRVVTVKEVDDDEFTLAAKKKRGEPQAHAPGYAGLHSTGTTTVDDAQAYLYVVLKIRSKLDKIKARAAREAITLAEAVASRGQWLEVSAAYVDEVPSRFGGEVAEKNDVFRRLSVIAELAQLELRGVREGEE